MTSFLFVTQMHPSGLSFIFLVALLKALYILVLLHGHLFLYLKPEYSPSESEKYSFSVISWTAWSLFLKSCHLMCEIMLTCICLVSSKLSTYTECCYALAETPRCCSLFLDLLGKHSRKQVSRSFDTHMDVYTLKKTHARTCVDI